MRLHRLMAILLLLESRGQVKAKEMATALETSVRTIYRDIDTLCEAGVPIAAMTGPNGGIYLMGEYSVKMDNLHSEDVINLYLSGVGIHPGGQSDTGIRLKNALLKLEQSLPAGYRGDIAKARKLFYFDETPWWGQVPQIRCLDSLRKALWQGKKVQMTYQKMFEAGSSRVIRPYGLVVKAMEWYLVAFCEGSGIVRTFKCERVAEARILDEACAIPEEFSLEGYWKQSAQQFFDTRMETEQYPVTIRLPKYKDDRLKQLSVYEVREEGGHLVAAVNMHRFDLALDEVLDVMGYAEVLEPRELRDHVREKITQLAEVYAAGPDSRSNRCRDGAGPDAGPLFDEAPDG